MIFSGGKKKTKPRKYKEEASSESSSISTADMRIIIDRLKFERVRTTTRRNYYSVWKTFNEFIMKLDVKPTNWEDRLSLFIGYIIEYKKVQSQTIRSYISAINTVLKEDNYNLSEDKFLLSSLTRECRYRNNSTRMRLLIQKNLLVELLKFTDNYYKQQGQFYLATLFKALFVTSYFGLFRVCKLTLTLSSHVVRVMDVHIGKNKRKILFILRTSKTLSKSNRLQMIKISTKGDGNETSKRKSLLDKSNGRFCPYELIRDYIDLRPKFHDTNEQFFVFRDYSPVTELHFRSTLHLMLKMMAYDKKLYNYHSFCIGRSCDLMKYGLTVETIQKIGRWKSNIVYAYLQQYFLIYT